MNEFAAPGWGSNNQLAKEASCQTLHESDTAALAPVLGASAGL